MSYLRLLELCQKSPSRKAKACLPYLLKLTGSLKSAVPTLKIAIRCLESQPDESELILINAVPGRTIKPRDKEPSEALRMADDRVIAWDRLKSLLHQDLIVFNAEKRTSGYEGDVAAFELYISEAARDAGSQPDDYYDHLEPGPTWSDIT